MPGIPVMTSSVLSVEAITFSLNLRSTDVTFETVELAAGVEPMSLVCALAAAGIRSRAKAAAAEDRKSVVEGTTVSVRVDLGGSRNIKKKKKKCISMTRDSNNR